MTNLNRMSWRWVVAGLFLALSACGGAAEVEDVLGTSESALTCTCGAETFTVVRRATSVNCARAYDQANSLADEAIAAACPAGGCNLTRSLQSCAPVGPNGSQGFSMGVLVTYSCNEPDNCVE